MRSQGRFVGNKLNYNSHTKFKFMARLMKLDSVRNIMSQRSLITESLVGKLVALTIQGNGNIIDVKDSEGEFVQSLVEEGTVLRKKIFNCKANSAAAMSNARTQGYLKAAVAAEKAGYKFKDNVNTGEIVNQAKADEAHASYNDYLNACQISFGILLPSAKIDHLSDGVEIAAKVTKVTTTKGSLLTLDPTSVRVMAPEYAGKTVFNVEDYLAEEPAAA